jgi:hypothetical protein
VRSALKTLAIPADRLEILVGVTAPEARLASRTAGVLPGFFLGEARRGPLEARLDREPAAERHRFVPRDVDPRMVDEVVAGDTVPRMERLAVVKEAVEGVGDPYLRRSFRSMSRALRISALLSSLWMKNAIR